LLSVKLIQLKLKNFRQHADSKIDFADGMTAIVGANGTGKSTILEAIAYVLYGEQRDTRDTIRFFWAEERGLSVALEFELEGRRFLVERKPNDASLRVLGEDGRSWAVGLRPVTETCERLLGLNYEQFKNSFCAEQKGLAFLQFTNRRARQEEVARMLGFHRLKAAEELAYQKRQTLNGQVTTLETMLGDPQEVENNRKDAEFLHKATLQSMEEAESIRDTTEQKLAGSAERFSQAQRWLELASQMREIGGKAEGLKESVRLTRKELDSAQAEATELSSLAPLEAEYQKVDQEVRRLCAARESEQQIVVQAAECELLRKDAESLREKAKALGASEPTAEGESLEAIRTQVERLREDIQKAEQTWRDEQMAAQAVASGASVRLSQAKQALLKAQKAFESGICGECGQTTGELYVEVVREREASVREFEAAVEEARKRSEACADKPTVLLEQEGQLKALETRLAEASAACEQAERLWIQAKNLLDQAEQKERRATQLQEQMASLPRMYSPEEHARLDKRLEELKPKHDRMLRLEGANKRLEARALAHDQAATALESAKARYRELETERKDLGFEGEAGATQAVADHQRLLQEMSSAVTKVFEKKNQLQLAETALQNAKARLDEVKKRQQELKSLKERHTLHDLAVKEMRKLRLALNAAIGPELAVRASENLSLLTNGRYDTLRLDGDFDAEVVEDGVTKKVISGGEEDVVALALRLSLSELIQERQGRPLSLLILDEVFGSLDTDRRQAVLDRLTALKGRFRQILVISHIEEINQVADQCLYLTRDPEKRSTKVSDAPPQGFGELG
jgi:DNA repair protein SbcC/Rad50